MSNPNKQTKNKNIGLKEILAVAGVAGTLGALVIHEQIRSTAPSVGPINGPHKEYIWKASDQSLLDVARRAYGPEKALDAEWKMEHEQGLVPGEMNAGEPVILSQEAKIGHLVNTSDESLGSGPNG